jgi:general secretion pathway protein M
VLVLLVAAAGAYALLAMPLLNLYAERASLIEDRRALAQRLAGVAAELPALRARLAALRTSASASRVVLDGTSDAVAAANLQGRIQELAAPLGVTIGTMENLTVETRGAYHRIGVRVGLTGEFATVVKLLSALQTVTPPLVIDNLRISAGMVQMSPHPVTQLEASFEAYGFRASETAPPGKS